MLRRRLGPDPDPYGLAVLELHRYSRGVVGFLKATMANPDILTDADVGPGSIVVDAGAFVGEWAGKVHERYHPTIYAFEPSPGAAAALERQLGSAADVTVVPVGLGAADAEAALDLAQGPGATVYADEGGEHVVAVPIRDVDAVFRELGLDHVDLLKLNIEGAEYDVLDRLLERGWLPRIGTVSVQFHEWHPDAHRRRRRIRRALRETHDEVWTYPWVWELWARRGGTEAAHRPPRHH